MRVSDMTVMGTSVSLSYGSLSAMLQTFSIDSGVVTEILLNNVTTPESAIETWMADENQKAIILSLDFL